MSGINCLYINFQILIRPLFYMRKLKLWHFSKSFLNMSYIPDYHRQLLLSAYSNTTANSHNNILFH